MLVPTLEGSGLNPCYRVCVVCERTECKEVGTHSTFTYIGCRISICITNIQSPKLNRKSSRGDHSHRSEYREVYINANRIKTSFGKKA